MPVKHVTSSYLRSSQVFVSLPSTFLVALGFKQG